MFSTPETSVHVQDKNREISPLDYRADLESEKRIWNLWLLLRTLDNVI